MKRFSPLALGVWVGSVVLSSGCGPGTDSSDWTGRVETLSNGAVRVVNPAQGLWADGGQWSLTEDLVLGRIEGPEEEVFSTLIALEVDDAGRIYLLDRDINQLRIFDSDGSYLRSAGGAGEGPGEFRAANGLEWLGGDSLLIVDQPGNRYSIFTMDGEFQRSLPRGLGFFSWAYRGGVVGSRVYEMSSVRDGEEWRPALFGVSIREGQAEGIGSESPPGEEGPSRPVAVVDTVLLPVSDAPPSESYSIRTDRGGMTMAVPFAAGAIYHLTHAGELWHGHGSEFRIYQSALQGDTLREIVVDSEPVPVLPQEIEEFEASEGARQFRELGGELDLGRIPKNKPYFDNLYLDSDGYLWVSIPSEPQVVSFGVIDPEGRYLGRLTLRGFERERFIDPVVKNGRLHLVGRNELDVQQVHVFTIHR